MSESSFDIIGGEHDGETVRMVTRWDGRGHRPPEYVQLAPPREPMPIEPRSEIPTTESFEPTIYHLHVWQKGQHRWYDYRPDRQTG